jgi:putative N6-adenine-specific DNA methylase
VTSKKSKLYHAGAVEQRLLEVVEKAVGAEEAREAEPVRGQNPQLFIVRLFRDQCTISVDSSGELLHRRGYREQGGKAPLRETLAAAMLLACGWNGETPLLDPLCGSGTIVIEAALLARRIPPGLKRAFAFQDWPEFDAVAWRTVREDAEAGVLPACPAPLLGSDRDAGAIRAAIANSERAGVLGDIGFRRAALSAIEPPVGAGWILTNPPYGVRVGDRLRLRDLYAQLGNVARKRCAGWMVGMLSADSMLEAQTGLAFQERFRTKNGGIGVRLVTASVPAQQ